MCRKHNHGQQQASCAVDALAEIYYHGVYPNDPQARISGGNTLIEKLIKLCDLRKRHGPICEVREDIWNWLSTYIPGYYPKGTAQAEILQAFENLSDNCNKFVATYQGTGTCPNCNMQYPVHENLDPVYIYDCTVNVKTRGNLAAGIDMMLGNAIHNRVRKISCEQCSVPLIPQDKVPSVMPAFLVVSLPLDKDTKQVQRCPIAVQEELSLHDTTYKLVGAVQMRPGHFYSIVQDGESFAVLDDLIPVVKQYPTFGSAVNKSVTTGTPTTCNLSRSHDGVHILVYSAKHTHSGDSISTNPSGGMPGPSQVTKPRTYAEAAAKGRVNKVSKNANVTDTEHHSRTYRPLLDPTPLRTPPSQCQKQGIGCTDEMCSQSASTPKKCRSGKELPSKIKKINVKISNLSPNKNHKHRNKNKANECDTCSETNTTKPNSQFRAPNTKMESMECKPNSSKLPQSAEKGKSSEKELTHCNLSHADLGCESGGFQQQPSASTLNKITCGEKFDPQIQEVPLKRSKLSEHKNHKHKNKHTGNISDTTRTNSHFRVQHSRIEMMECTKTSVKPKPTSAEKENNIGNKMCCNTSHTDLGCNSKCDSSGAFHPLSASTPTKSMSGKELDPEIQKRKHRVINKENEKKTEFGQAHFSSHIKTQKTRIPLQEIDVNVKRDNVTKGEENTSPETINTQENKKLTLDDCAGSEIQLTKLREEALPVHTVKILETEISFTQFDNQIFVATKILKVLGLNTHEGYRKFDDLLMKFHDKNCPAVYLVGKRNARKWICKDALETLIKESKINQNIDKEQLIKSISDIQNRIFTSPTPCPDMPDGFATTRLCDTEVEMQTHHNVIYIDFSKIAELVGIGEHIRRRGWKFIDNLLAKEGIDISASFKAKTKPRRKKRAYISVSALHVLLTKFRSGDCTQKEKMRNELLTQLEKLAAQAIKYIFQTDSSRMFSDSFENSNNSFDTSKNSFESSSNSSNNSFENSNNIFESSKDSIEKPKDSIENSNETHDSCKQTYLKPEDMIYLTENFSGSRLRNEFRKKNTRHFSNCKTRECNKENIP